MRFWMFIGDYFKNHWIRLVGATVYCLIICAIYNWLNDGFTLALNYVNGLFIAGATIFCFGLLILVNYFGGFDMFSYLFRAKIVNNHRETLYDYSVRKKAERRPSLMGFIDYLIVGTIFMLISSIIYWSI